MYEIYTRENCPQCDQTKSFFSTKRIAFKEIVVGKDITVSELKEDFPTANILPIILRDGLRITSLDELKALLEYEQYLHINS
jgi:hypothetical protein